MSNVVQFRRTTAVLALVAASVGGGLVAAFAVASRTNAPVSVIAHADTATEHRAAALSDSFADIIEKASPAVVKISMTRIIKASDQKGNGTMSPFGNDPFFQQFFGGRMPKPRDQREEGLGSGVLVSPNGYILTNNHVVDKANKLKVTLSDGRDYTAKLVGADPQTDVAVVKIDAGNLPTLPFANSSGARVGDLCFAIGNPFGQDHTVTMGIVSAKGRSLEAGSYIQDFIQTDAAINPGNSGGALINAKGELIGMNTMILTGGNSFGGGEGGNVGIGFAVPSNMAKQVMDQLIKSGKVSRGYIGVTLESLTPDLAQQFGVSEAKGALVGDVTANAPGAKAGLKSGDVVTAIDGKQVTTSNDLTMEVISRAPGTTVKLDVIRDKKPMTVSVTLGQRPAGTDWDRNGGHGNENEGGNDDNNADTNSSTVRGITVENLTSEIAQQVGVPPATRGVVVTAVDADSPAADAVGRGTVVVAVDRKPVANVTEFRNAMNAAKDKAVLLTVNNGGATGFVVVQPK
jgi:serine protease Do